MMTISARFLDPEAGQSTDAGCDLRLPRLGEIGRSVSVAGQDSLEFSAGIGDHGVSGARTRATRGLSLHSDALGSWLSPRGPDRLDTFVGEEGRKLSDAQRQRLVFARSPFVDAPVLVLDGPTAHLDASTASELVRDICSVASDHTVLLITRRSEGLDRVDRVLTPHAGLGVDHAEPVWGRRWAT